MQFIRKYRDERLAHKLFLFRLHCAGKQNLRNYRLRKALLYFNYVWLVASGALTAFLTLNFSFYGKSIVRTIITLFIALAIIIPYSLLIDRLFPFQLPPALKDESITKFTAPLRAYYGLGSEFVVTKCYRCTKMPFEKQDVLVYWHGAELRITIDFFHSPRDIGCCIIPKQALSFQNILEDGRTCTVISCPDFEMVLGYRAGTFLKKAQINTK